jgi:hypothetical protein
VLCDAALKLVQVRADGSVRSPQRPRQPARPHHRPQPRSGARRRVRYSKMPETSAVAKST